MQLHHRARTLVAACAVLAFVPAAASAAPNPRAGIAHAKHAGILVDPDAEAEMADAPIGTCGNDPTLADCPKGVHAIVFSPEMSESMGATAQTSRMIGEPSRKIKRLRAKMADLLGACHIDVIAGSPYKAAGLAQADFRANCYTGQDIERQDVEVKMSKYDLNLNDWRQITTRYTPWVPIGPTRYDHLSSGCSSTATRAWGARITGWSWKYGVIYQGTQAQNNNLACNYP